MDVKKLRAFFEKWNEKFRAKKEFFKNKVDAWGEGGYEELNKKGLSLLSQAESHIQEIEKSFAMADDQIDTAALKGRIKTFKSVFKELNDSTKPEWRQWLEALVVAGTIVFVVRNYFFGLYHVPTGSAEVNMLVGDRVWGNKFAYRAGSTPQYGDLVMFDDPNFKYNESNPVQYFWQKYIGFGIPILGLGDGPNNFVKRVIAIPGDTVEGRLEDGKPVVYRNGERLDEPYVNPHPLIGLEKKTGFFDFDYLGFFPLPEFLKRTSKPVFYSYDHEKEFSDQPYYSMSSAEVLLEPGTLRPWLKFPDTPTKNRHGRVVDEFGPITLPAGKYWVMGDSRKNSEDARFWGMLDESLIHGRASFILYSVDSEEPFWLFELIKSPVAFWIKSVRWNRFLKTVDGYKGTVTTEVTE